MKKVLILVGVLAGSLTDDGWTPSNLRKIFGYCAGWLVSVGERHVAVVISAERERQELLFSLGKFTFTCASKTADAKRKLRVLVEEVGEVAEAIEKLEMARNQLTKGARAQCLRDVLTQVAAVTVAWLESMEKTA